MQFKREGKPKDWVQFSEALARRVKRSTKWAGLLRHCERQWFETRTPPPYPRKGRHIEGKTLGSKHSQPSCYSKRSPPGKLPYSPQPSMAMAPRRGYYAPYYYKREKATQQRIAPGDDTYEALRPTPTSDSIRFCSPPESHSGRYAPGLLPWDRITKLTTPLVIQVPPTDALALIKKRFLLSNRARPVRLCGQQPPRPSAPSAGASATQLLDAQKPNPNVAVFAAIYCTQPELTHPINSMRNRPCRRRPTASAHIPLPSASTVVPITQPLVQSVWKRLRNSTPEQVSFNVTLFVISIFL